MRWREALKFLQEMRPSISSRALLQQRTVIEMKTKIATLVGREGYIMLFLSQTILFLYSDPDGLFILPQFR
jgi:hypothetical protein